MLYVKWFTWLKDLGLSERNVGHLKPVFLEAFLKKEGLVLALPFLSSKIKIFFSC